jgi:hypothetical protein
LYNTKLLIHVIYYLEFMEFIGLKKNWFIIICCTLSFTTIKAQSKFKSVLNKVFFDTKEMDIKDVYKIVFNKKNDSIKEYDKKFQVVFLPVVGYTLQTGFAVSASGNATFYTDKTNPKQKQSTIYTSFAYTQKKQVIFPFVINLWTKNNKLNIISDNRYTNYPKYVFGVGNETNPKLKYTSGFSAIRLHESILKKVAPNTSIGVGFFFDNFFNIRGFDTIYKQIPFNKTTIRREVASGFGVRFLYDNRINQVKANKGFVANIVYRDNRKYLGSNYNWSYLTTDVRTYVTFPKSSKNVLAIWDFNWLSFGKNITNFLLPSNGWDDFHNTGRGYLQGRFRGRNMYYLEAEYRMQLTKNGLLGATFFSNAMHFSKEYFHVGNKIKYGAGLGLRIKFNKYSDTNLCIDYAWGQDGSKGFFINLGEVF